MGERLPDPLGTENTALGPGDQGGTGSPGVSGKPWVEARDIGKYPTVQRAVSPANTQQRIIQPQMSIALRLKTLYAMEMVRVANSKSCCKDPVGSYVQYLSFLFPSVQFCSVAQLCPKVGGL